MNACRFLVLLPLVFLGCSDPPSAPADADQVIWTIDDLHSIGGHAVTVLGAPTVIDTPHGKAVEFDGEDDGLVVDVHPVAGAAQFTAEVVFRPDPEGEEEQRFLHLQETGSKDRLLFETRTTDDGTWFLDTYIKSEGQGYTLFAKRFEHPFGGWYHAALVVDAQGVMRHYVDGRIELSKSIDFSPQKQGQTSIGVRMNEVSWFKGAIRQACFTPRVLSPGEFCLGGGSGQ